MTIEHPPTTRSHPQSSRSHPAPLWPGKTLRRLPVDVRHAILQPTVVEGRLEGGQNCGMETDMEQTDMLVCSIHMVLISSKWNIINTHQHL